MRLNPESASPPPTPAPKIRPGAPDQSPSLAEPGRPGPGGRSAPGPVKREFDPILIGVVLGVIVVAVAAVVILTTSSHSAPVRTQTTAIRTTTTTPTAAAAPRVTTPVLAPMAPAVAGREVVTVLNRYATAFTRHSLPGLTKIFSPQIARRGLTSTGCTVSRGRAAVLSAYASEFTGLSGAYRLPGLGPAKVKLSGPGSMLASVSASFTIAGTDRGSIGFQLSRGSGIWQITHISAAC